MSRASVILSAYNRPHYVVRSLQSLARQSVTDFEVIIADDGSNEEARSIVDRHLGESPLAARRVWQADDGFRKTKILNAAVSEARADYLVFTDSDCVLFPDFIAQHLALRGESRFLSAGALKLTEGPTERILDGRLPVAEAFSWRNLRAAGLPPRLKFRRMFLGQGARVLLDAVLPIKKTFNGLNASCWRRDAEAIGGFDESMGYGSEDVEFGVRLSARGVTARRVRHRIRALHLDHDRPYARPEEMSHNRRAVRERAKALGGVAR